eukprot:CAMPEP_0171813190 /NCGR_PEP_ID=MMETSP0991-20121206/79081_1 /TAXON_ID=483369 /ORGANISM="non described non described, Strain CCMP2098" /LENGTH=159 /DNA_ID=CAMNT_0012426751 /DNA_START=22 /DNA_END=498 /DNA_ORIENTATION=-
MAGKPKKRSPKQALLSSLDSFSLDFASGEAWGRKSSFVLRARLTLPSTTVDKVLTVIRDRRQEWDPSCISIDVLESGQKQDREEELGEGVGGDGKTAAAATTPTPANNNTATTPFASAYSSEVGCGSAAGADSRRSRLHTVSLLRPWSTCDSARAPARV